MESVNPGLRFVVIDFAFNPVPQVDQRMSIYRQGQKVGEADIPTRAATALSPPISRLGKQSLETKSVRSRIKERGIDCQHSSLSPLSFAPGRPALIAALRLFFLG